jgi:hypothetical protein
MELLAIPNLIYFLMGCSFGLLYIYNYIYMYVQLFVRNDYMVMIEAWDVFKIVFGPPRWD